MEYVLNNGSRAKGDFESVQIGDMTYFDYNRTLRAEVVGKYVNENGEYVVQLEPVMF